MDMNNSLSIREEERYYLNPNNVGINNVLNYTNKAWICGTLETDLEFSHEFAWETFYKTTVKVHRLSGNVDYIPAIISGYLLHDGPSALKIGMHVELGGQIRTHNYRGKDDRNHVEVFLFVTAINVIDEYDDEEFEDANLIYLEGNLCKEPVYRVTPFGRQITDLKLAVNRAHFTADYIPCIAWMKVARFASTLSVGDKIKLFGRIQSREYFKRISPDSDIGETRIAYEVSILRMKKEEVY